jgi:predicted CoA-binding protein
VKTVAVIGASNDRRKYGNKALRAFRTQGYRVIPINPHAATVEGEPAYATVLDYPEPIDIATIYVQPNAGVRVMDQIARKGIPTVWLNPGADAPAVVSRAQALGVKTIEACSILAIGESPGDY